jgi:hypothetical protein
VAGRKHLMAVNRAIKSANLDTNPLDAPMVELLRDLARKMDAAGKDGPPLNLMRAYLSATKDLSRASARKPVAKTPVPESSVSEPVEMTGPVAVEESPLDRLRRKKKSA